MMERAYHHISLPEDDSIRVLELQPGEQADDLHVNLHVITLSSRTPYIAISYVWGAPDDRTTIHCHGKAMRIPQNLTDVLKVLRDTRSPRLLWADSICIDQENNNREKTRQVALMGKIYEQASEVRVWLGSDPDGTAASAFSLVRQIARHEHPLLPRKHTDLQLLQEDEPISDLVHMMDQANLRDFENFEDHEAERWRHLAELYRRPWFTRLWVIQEVGLASQAWVMFGSEIIAWREISDTAKCIAIKARAIADHLRMESGVWDCNTLTQIFSTKRRRLNILEVLLLSEGFDASEPRDKVYAVLSHPSAMMSDGQLILQPDYECSMAQLNTTIALQFLKWQGSLYLLSAVHHMQSEDLENSERVSWIPCWEKDTQYMPFWLDDRRSIHWAASDTPACFRLSSDERKLTVTGICFDQVHDYGSIVIGKFTNQWKADIHVDGNKRSLGHLRELSSLIHNHPQSRSSIYATNKEVWVAACRTLTGGAPTVNLTDFMAFLSKYPEPCALFEEYAHGGVGEWFVHVATTKTANRRTFITRKGYVGLGSRPMQKDGIVCVLFGCPVPFLLRKSEHGYRLVGECYVHGIMHGQVIRAWRRNEFTEQEFELH